MMLVVRLYPKRNLDALWNGLEKNKEMLSTRNYTALYANHLLGNNFISVIFQLNNPQFIDEFYLKTLAKMPDVRKTETLTLIKTQYYCVPKERPKTLYRFQLHLNCDPISYEKVYNSICDLKMPKNIFLTYVSFSFGRDDIIASVLSESADAVLKLIEDKVSKMDGVETVRFTQVTKMLRLVNTEKWTQHKMKYLAPHQKGKDMEIEYEGSIEDLAALTGGFVHEMRR